MIIKLIHNLFGLINRKQELQKKIDRLNINTGLGFFLVEKPDGKVGIKRSHAGLSWWYLTPRSISKLTEWIFAFEVGYSEGKIYQQKLIERQEYKLDIPKEC